MENFYWAGRRKINDDINKNHHSKTNVTQLRYNYKCVN